MAFEGIQAVNFYQLDGKLMATAEQEARRREGSSKATSTAQTSRATSVASNGPASKVGAGRSEVFH